MSLVNIKARVKAVLEGVSDIGNVFDHLPYIKDAEGETKQLVGAKGRLHVWAIRREALRLVDINQNESQQEQLTRLVIHGFYAVKEDDGTEATFDALVDAVLIALNNDRQPVIAGGTKLNAAIQAADPPELRLTDERHYGPSGTLCHHCEIVLNVTEDVQ